MNCQQIDEYLIAYCDNTLSPELRVLLDEHLSSCECCQNKVRFTRMENSILADGVGIPTLSEDFTARVMQSVSNMQQLPAETKEAISSSIVKQKRRRNFLGGAAAAAVILIALSLPSFFPMGNKIQTADICEESEINDPITNYDTGYGQNPELSSTADEKTTDYAKPEDIRVGNTSEPIPADETSMNNQNSAAKEAPAYVPLANDTQKRVALYDGAIEDLESDSDSAPREQTSISFIQSEMITPEIAPKDYKLDLLSIHPNNLPPEYTLEKIINTSSEETTYIYKNTETTNNLEITLSFAADTSNIDGVEKSVYYDKDTSSTADSNEEIQYASAAEMNFVNLDVLHEDCTINLTFKSLMPLEELESLAYSITFDD